MPGVEAPGYCQFSLRDVPQWIDKQQLESAGSRRLTTNDYSFTPSCQNKNE
jgi:hypothetical protein